MQQQALINIITQEYQSNYSKLSATWMRYICKYMHVIYENVWVNDGYAIMMWMKFSRHFCFSLYLRNLSATYYFFYFWLLEWHDSIIQQDPVCCLGIYWILVREKYNQISDNVLYLWSKKNNNTYLTSLEYLLVLWFLYTLLPCRGWKHYF